MKECNWAILQGGCWWRTDGQDIYITTFTSHENTAYDMKIQHS